MLAVDIHTGKCLRCHAAFFAEDDEDQTAIRCSYCGVGVDRIVRSRRRHAKLGGKRGRNSGKVSQHGKKN